ncbi:MAG: hypothetical protein RIR00_1970 [Pseudomonadota bacterium]|jgi:RND family efflux transporter MFP subunit
MKSARPCSPSARRPARLPLVALLLPALLAACQRQAPPPEPPRPVLTQVIGRGNQDQSLQFSGEIRSRIETPLSFRVGGKLVARLVDAGAVVKPGQVLARLDPSDTQLNAGAAQAVAQQANADAQRFKELQARNFVSQAALDAKEASARTASAQAALAGNQSHYTTLKADQAGVITQVSGEVGQVVAAGQAVFRFSRPDLPELAIAIPENRIGTLKVGSRGEVSLWAGGDKVYQGEIREIAPAADPASRSFAARVRLLQPDAQVHLGMTAQVRFAGVAQGLVLPLAAIFQQQNQPAVWVVGPEGQLQLRPIQVGAWQENGALVASGLQDGERVVVAGVHKLKAGETVRLAESGARP